MAISYMKAKPYKREMRDGQEWVIPCEVADAELVMLHLPGPLSTLHIPVILKGKREGTGNWTWNGDTEKPTLRPSILNDFRKHDPDGMVNHIWITDGNVIFLDDCTHELAGQTLPMLDVS